MKIHLFLYMLVFIAVTSCNKDKFLSAKPSSSLVVPGSLTDFQALLDAYRMNETPSLGEASADNYVITSNSAFNGLAAQNRNTYTWAKDIFQGQGLVPDWDIPYQDILYANVVIEGLGILGRDQTKGSDWDNIMGQALFIRAYHFYNLLQVFAPPYDSTTAQNDLGIPLRLSADVSASVGRSNLRDCYSQIINDLNSARYLLPPQPSPANRNRASLPAVFAMLSRVYLAAGNYSAAAKYADSCLQLYNVLIDFNDLTSAGTTPFTRLNTETMLQSKLYSGEQVLFMIRFQIAGFSVDTLLYKLYDSTDLRRYYYFVPKPGGIFTKSSYSGETGAFTGLAVDEVLLNRAESYIRTGRMTAGMEDLNALLIKRYKTGSFIPLVAKTQNEALTLVLQERRKELLIRGTRWTDLRRLNKLGAQITLHRNISGVDYALLANSPLYTLPIPPDAVALGNYPQNIR